MTLSIQPEKPFETPWHAEVFALAVHLNETGVFSWQEWVESFARNLKGRRASMEADPETDTGHLDGADDYYHIWLMTLDEILHSKGCVESAMVDKIAAEWRDAYLITPHGHPVQLD